MTLKITTAAKTKTKGKIPMFRKSLKVLAFLPAPVDISSFCTRKAKRTRMPIIAKDPANVTVDTVEVVTVEIMVATYRYKTIILLY
jgi:hypothetical protein